MKKFLLSAALIACFSFAAKAELSYTCQGETYYDGDVINYEGFEYVAVPDKDGNPTGMYQFKVDPEIFLISTVSTTTGTVTSTSNVAVNLCAGGDCVNGTNNKKDNVVLEANVPLNLQMDYAPAGINFGEDVEVPSITVKITSTVDGESATVTVNMGGFTAGVESIGANLNAISVKGKTLNYDVIGSAQLSLYSLSGKTVYNQAVAGNGSVSLAHLPAGVYLYRLAGKNNKAGKFIVK